MCTLERGVMNSKKFTRPNYLAMIFDIFFPHSPGWSWGRSLGWVCDIDDWGVTGQISKLAETPTQARGFCNQQQLHQSLSKRRYFCEMIIDIHEKLQLIGYLNTNKTLEIKL